MTRRGRITIAAAVGAIALAVAPLLLRQVPFFRVRRVEVMGARYLAPVRVLGALALAPDQNLFDPLGGPERRVAELPGVVRASVSRRLPATLRVTIVERQPVAFVSSGEGMIPLDCDGAALPYDPSSSWPALPIVARADTVLLQALCVVRAGDSTLYDAVDAVRPDGSGAVILDLGRQSVRLREAPTTDDVRAVAAVLRQLVATGRTVDEVDARFSGRIYARRGRS
jgi:cell division protein FtsQ